MKNITGIKPFLVLSGIFIVAGAIIILLNDKEVIHLSVNHYHSPFFDRFFTYLTFLGDGLFAAILVALIVIFSKKQNRLAILILGASTLLFSGLIAQFLKRVVYPDAERPLKYLGERLLHLVPDVSVHEWNSFPSGHATTAFAICAFLAMLLHKKSWVIQIMLVFAAVLISYSRMYLSQHFLEDVVMGAIIGILSFLLAYLLLSLLPLKNKV